MNSFPVDDVTLSCIEHAMKGAYTVDEDGTHHLVGADYSLHELLDFVSGAYDPPGLEPDDNPALIPEGTDVYYDVREHYTEHDVIRALIHEVRRLRGIS